MKALGTWPVSVASDAAFQSDPEYRGKAWRHLERNVPNRQKAMGSLAGSTRLCSCARCGREAVPVYPFWSVVAAMRMVIATCEACSLVSEDVLATKRL